MEDKVKDGIREAAVRSLQQEFKRCRDQEAAGQEVRELSEDEVVKLSEKIEALPLELRSILYFHYCFGVSPRSTEEILNKAQAGDQLAYAKKILSVFMGMDAETIGDVYLEKACEMANRRETAIEENASAEFAHRAKPRYTRRFRNTLKDIPAAQKRNARMSTLMKRAAVAVIAASICFSMAIGANGDLRGMLVAWFVKTTQEYSQFRAFKDDAEVKDVNFEDFNVGYIPEGYELESVAKTSIRLSYFYEHMSEKYIKVILNKNDIYLYLDTENTIMKDFEFKGKTAYRWSSDDINYLVWKQDGISCQIAGGISNEEILKIAENIEKIEN